ALRGVRDEKAHTDRLEPAGRRLDEDAPERDEGDHDAGEGGAAHPEVLQPRPGIAVEDELHAATSPTRKTRRTMSRAKMLIARDMSMRTSPSSRSALSSSGPASVKLFAIQLAIVCPWSNRET